MPPLMVTPEARRDAKAVNFGIVYGISPFGLAAQLGISRAEAEKYIRNYFARYAGVRQFIDATIAEVRQHGRDADAVRARAAHPRHQQPQPQRARLRRAHRGEFAAAGHGGRPDQAGDGAHRRRAAQPAAIQRAMLLQVHDELVFECPPEETQKLAAMVKREMEQVYPLEVPLVVDIGVGDNWRDAK